MPISRLSISMRQSKSSARNYNHQARKPMTLLTMKPNPFTPARRYAICPACAKAFDPVSQFEYASLPDDCDGVVENLQCTDCTWQVGPQAKPVALAVLAAVL